LGQLVEINLTFSLLILPYDLNLTFSPLTNAGRVLLTKVTLFAVLVHLSIVCCLSSWAVKQIDKLQRAFIWAGTASCIGGKCKVAWSVVCRPTYLGGLGVIDLHFFGLALRLR
jgi:hypothetical protein